MKMQAWDVLLKVPAEYDTESVFTVQLPHAKIEAHLMKLGVDHDYFLIDTVFYDAKISRREVRLSLINHDGYPSGIVVEKGK